MTWNEIFISPVTQPYLKGLLVSCDYTGHHIEQKDWNISVLAEGSVGQHCSERTIWVHGILSHFENWWPGSLGEKEFLQRNVQMDLNIQKLTPSKRTTWNPVTWWKVSYFSGPDNWQNIHSWNVRAWVFSKLALDTIYFSFSRYFTSVCHYLFENWYNHLWGMQCGVMECFYYTLKPPWMIIYSVIYTKLAV
jgi:hypothetical protein